MSLVRCGRDMCSVLTGGPFIVLWGARKLNRRSSSASVHPDHCTTRRGGYRKYGLSSKSFMVVSSWC